MKIGITGITGKMGQAIANLVHQDDIAELCTGLVRQNSGSENIDLGEMLGFEKINKFTTSDINISVGGGQALKQNKAQVNSKTSMNQEAGVDNIGLQFTHSDKEQIALLTREMIHLKEEMGIDSTTANLQEEKQKLLEEKGRLFRK